MAENEKKKKRTLLYKVTVLKAQKYQNANKRQFINHVYI